MREPTERDHSSHGAALQRQEDEAVRRRRRPVSEGVDPRHVFKVRITTRMGHEAWRPRGSSLEESTEGWQYVVVT